MPDRTGSALAGARIAALRRSLPLTLVVAIAACGRLGFDDQSASSGATDAHTTGPGVGGTDATSSHDSGGSGPDATIAAGNGVGTCANPIVLTYGETLSNLSIEGATDDFDAGCGAGVDSVFQITLTSAVGQAGFHVDADFTGNLDGIGDLCPTPPPPSGCAQFNPLSGTTLGRPLPAGTHYVFVQKKSGTGVTFSITSM